MSETAATHTLKGNIKSVFPGAHLQRFEDSLSAGIPDSNMCWDGIECWLEGKFVKQYPKRKTTKVRVGLRPEQRVWMKARTRAGGKCYVWVRCPDGWYLFNETSLDDLFNGIELEEWLRHPRRFASSKEMLRELKEDLTCQ